jgi:hypothetical protein
MTTVPAHAGAHALLPVRHVCTHGVDDAHHLVPGHSGVLNARKCAGDREHVAVADAARLHLDAYLPRSRLGYVTLDDFELTTGLGDLNDLHT